MGLYDRETPKTSDINKSILRFNAATNARPQQQPDFVNPRVGRTYAPAVAPAVAPAATQFPKLPASKRRGGGAFMVNSFDLGDPTNVDTSTVNTDPYFFGGDGAIAREAGPEKQSTNIGGLPRDELIRRMEIAGSSMRGSPTARGAVMGMYADSVKAIDAGELQKNQGNIEAGQTVYRGNMAANMQQAQGKQAFGNEMGILNRRGALETAANAAKADPEMRQAELNVLKADALMKKGEYEATIAGKQDKATTDKAVALFAVGKGGYATMADAENAAADQQADGGTDSRATSALRARDNQLTDALINRLGTTNFIGESMVKGFDNASIGAETLDRSKQYSMDDFETVPENSWVNSFRTAVGQEPIMVARPKGSKMGSSDPVLRLSPNKTEDVDLLHAIKRRERQTNQKGQ